MKEKQFRAAFKHESFDPIHDFSKIWFDKFYDHTTFHDPLASATIFNEDLCKFERGNVEIDMMNKKTLGMTRFIKNSKGKHEAASSVDSGKFFEHFCTIINKQ